MGYANYFVNRLPGQYRAHGVMYDNIIVRRYLVFQEKNAVANGIMSGGAALNHPCYLG